MNENAQHVADVPTLFHAVAEIFPLMTGAAFADLVEDIRTNGLREAIWRHDGKIIDGRNRYNACIKANVEPTYREWNGNGDGELIAFVVSMNLHRRHLEKSQQAIIASKLATRIKGHNTVHDKPSDVIGTECLSAPTVTQVAEMFEVSPRIVRQAKWVREHAEPEVVAAVEGGGLSLKMAEKIARAPREEQVAEMNRRLALKGRRDHCDSPSSNGDGKPKITTKTRTHPGRKAPAAIRGAIGTLVGLASGLDSFKAKDAAPSPEEADQWERDLALVVSAINRFRRQLKEHANA